MEFVNLNNFLLLADFNDQIDKFLGKNPLILGTLFFLIAAVLTGFAIHAYRSGHTWDKGGKRIKGKTAKMKLIQMIAFATFGYLFAFYQYGKWMMTPSRSSNRPSMSAMGGMGDMEGMSALPPEAAQVIKESEESFNAFEESVFVGHPLGSHTSKISAGILVGMVVTTDETGVISSLIPVSQQGSKRSARQELGFRGGDARLLLAEPDHAVVEVRVQGDGTISAIQLEYARYDESGIQSSERYSSDWVGVQQGTVTELNRNQNFIGGYKSKTGNGGFGLSLLMWPSNEPKARSIRMASSNPSLDSLLSGVEAKFDSRSNRGSTASNHPSAGGRSGGFGDRGGRGGRSGRVRGGTSLNDPPTSTESGNSSLANSDSNMDSGDVASNAERAAVEAKKKRIEELLARMKGGDMSAQSELQELLEQKGSNNSGQSGGIDNGNGFAGRRGGRTGGMGGRRGREFGNSQPDSRRGSQARSAVAAGEATDLGVAEIPLPPLKFKTDRSRNSELVGFDMRGDNFVSTAPQGGVLVGLRVGESSRMNREILNVQPIYQVRDKYFYGERVGPSGGQARNLLAEPGHVMTGLEISSGVSVNSLQCVFNKFDPQTGKISSTDFAISDLLGKKRNPDILDSESMYLIGMFGKHEDSMLAIGLSACKATVDKSVAVDKSAIRKWTSADLKHTFDAQPSLLS